MAFATSFEPWANAIDAAVTIMRSAKADSTPYSLIFSLLNLNNNEAINITSRPNKIVITIISLSLSGNPTCFNPFLAVTRAMITAAKKV